MLEAADIILIMESRNDIAIAAAVPLVRDINGINMTGKTPLLRAIQFELQATIRALGARGDCDPDLSGRLYNFGQKVTPLLAAVLHDTLRVFMDAFPAVDVNKSEDGWTALHAAAAYKCTADAALLLLAHGADANATFHTKTPLELARDWGRHVVADAIEAHVAWASSQRHDWMAAVTAATLHI